eukprot:scaffold78699_cov64-Phaeocystis_antarctica.AAC.2
MLVRSLQTLRAGCFCPDRGAGLSPGAGTPSGKRSAGTHTGGPRGLHAFRRNRTRRAAGTFSGHLRASASVPEKRKSVSPWAGTPQRGVLQHRTNPATESDGISGLLRNFSSTSRRHIIVLSKVEPTSCRHARMPASHVPPGSDSVVPRQPLQHNHHAM